MSDQFERVAKDFAKTLKRRSKIIGEFKAFITKGNAIDLAVGVVIGAAFNTVVQSLVNDVLTPIISIPGTANFNTNVLCLKGGVDQCAVPLFWGRFLTTGISFLLTSAAVFFFVVRPMNKLRDRRRGEDTPTSRQCPECLSEIPKEARRCAHCAQPVGAIT